ncbi:hypothetical protein HYV43_05160 [Candidatus Micrarchaeota archaeon]|nr:hypothetical protein [Candidatus Micrarchaeota archaeon]
MRDILYALRHVPATVHEWKDKAEQKKIQSAVTQLRRIRKAERDGKVRGIPLSKGDVYVAPHPAAKPNGSYPVPWNENGGLEHFFHQLGRLNERMEQNGRHEAFKELNAEVARVEALLLPPLKTKAR